MNQPRNELGKWGHMETNRMMQLHSHIKTPKKQTEQSEDIIILDQQAAKEMLGL